MSVKIKMVVANNDMQDTFNVLANKSKSRPWTEEFDTGCRCLRDAPPGLTATEYAQMVVDYFNNTLKPGEMPRRLVAAEMQDG